MFVIAPVVVDGTSQPGYDGRFSRIYVESTAGISSIFFLTARAGPTIKGIGLYNYDNNAVTIWKDASWNFIDDDCIGFKKTGSGIAHNTLRAPSCAGVGIQGNYNKIKRTTISGGYNGINVGEAIEKSTPASLRTIIYLNEIESALIPQARPLWVMVILRPVSF